MKTVLISKQTKVGDVTYFGGARVVSDDVADALVSSGNAVVKAASTPAARVAEVETVPADFYGPAAITSGPKAKPATKAIAVTKTEPKPEAP